MTDILRAAPQVKILVTSRAELKVQGEHRLPVGGMSFPESVDASLGNLDQYDAVQLFSESARRVLPTFDLADDNLTDVVRICHLVSGMPLGILMASAWVKVLSPAEIADEISHSLDFLKADLSDVPQRQRSMRAVFDHSWGLLTKRQRILFQTLSVFRGSFTREAIEQVTGASLQELKGLVDRSLVQRSPAPLASLRTGARYEMHELLRQYAAAELQKSADLSEAVGNRHCAYYVGVLEGWVVTLRGDRHPAALLEMDLDSENARAAWDWAAERAQASRLGTAIDGLFHYYVDRGARYWETEAACEPAAKRLAAQLCADGSEPGKAETLRVLARIRRWQSLAIFYLGNCELGTQLALQGVALLKRPELASLDTRLERAELLQGAAWAMAQPAPERSRRIWQQALELLREVGDQHGIAETLYRSGFTALWFGDPEKAAAQLRESIEISQTSGFRAMAAWGLRDLAMALLLSGQFDQAQSMLEHRLKDFDDLGEVTGSAHWRMLLGLVHLHLGNYEQARILSQRAVALFEQTASRWLTGVTLSFLACVALAKVEGPSDVGVPPEERERGEVREAYKVAEQKAWEAISISQGEDWLHGAATALSVLGLAARGMGRLGQAKYHLYESLQAASEIGVFQWAVIPLSAAAILAADGDESEWAVELYALASRYPYVANSRWFEDVFGRHIGAVAATLPPEVAETARERGRARDLDATLKELLAEFEPWGAS